MRALAFFLACLASTSHSRRKHPLPLRSPAAGRLLGIVKSYSPGNGWGFIASERVEADVYFQRRDLPEEFQNDAAEIVGRTVLFSLKLSPDKKPRASNVELQVDVPVGEGRKLWAQAGEERAKAQAAGLHFARGSPAKTYRGIVKSYSAATGWGSIVSDQVEGDVYFQRRDVPATQLVGQPVAFALKHAPDGKPQASGVEFHKRLFGVVKSYSAVKGWGFIVSDQVEGHVYFQRKDVPVQFQQNLDHIVGQFVNFGLKKTPDGKQQARDIELPPGNSVKRPVLQRSRAAVNHSRLSGVVISYNKGFGFIESQGKEVNVYFQRRDAPALMQNEEDLVVGKMVQFGLKFLPDGKPRAADVELVWPKRRLINGGAAQPNVPGKFQAVKTQPLPDADSGEAEADRFSGVVKSYHAAKGWGFIVSEDVGADVYFQRRDIEDELQRAQVKVVGQPVNFVMKFAPDRPPHASDVQLNKENNRFGA